MNSVPILNPLSQDEKLQLVDAFDEKTYQPGEKVSTCREADCIVWLHNSRESLIEQSAAAAIACFVMRHKLCPNQKLLLSKPQATAASAAEP